MRKSGRRKPQREGPEAEPARRAQSTEEGGTSVSESALTDEAGETSKVGQQTEFQFDPVSTGKPRG